MGQSTPCPLSMPTQQGRRSPKGVHKGGHPGAQALPDEQVAHKAQRGGQGCHVAAQRHLRTEAAGGAGGVRGSDSRPPGPPCPDRPAPCPDRHTTCTPPSLRLALAPAPRTCASLRAAAVASSTPPARPTAVPPSSPAEMGRPSRQVPPARKSGVADTNSREWVREVACTLYTHKPKWKARQTPLAASRPACGGAVGWEGRQQGGGLGPRLRQSCAPVDPHAAG